MSGARDPAGYAREKLPTLLERWRGQPGELVRWYGPTQWRGVPTTALIALTASSMGPHETVGDLASAASAVGLYGVEGPQVEAYTRDASVTALLGHASAPMPAYLDALADQVVTGIANYRRHLAEVTAALPQALRPSSVSTPYAYRLACGSYSLGAGVTSRVLRAFAGDLSSVPEAQRWDLLRRLLEHAAATAPTVGGVRSRGEWGAAHLAVRVDQRFECGRLLATTLGLDATWWGSPATSTNGLVALAYATPRAVAAVNPLVHIAALGLIGWAITRRRR